MRKAIGIWQAIMMILLVSGMMIVVLKYASISSKHVGDTYVREQADLYLNSVIEQTLLAISEHNRSLGCLRSFDANIPNFRGKTYRAHVDIAKYYLLNSSQDSTDCKTSGATVVDIESEETHGMVMLHVEVNASIDGDPVVRILRRTLQRP
ncbi:MAG: hypothetical protein U9N52_12050 [Campylobacterota bacterium]|nr:hypothetical protein [Campylobacterota bacterium]